MKIEKLNKDNIKEFIRDMKLSDAEGLELTVDKSELYGIKKDDVFYLGFNSLTTLDTIAILYYNSKLSNEFFYECINFLNKSLVVENHLIIDIYDKKYMNLLDDKYKCKEICAGYAMDGNDIKIEDISGNNILMREKLAQIEMKSIKYFASKDMVICNLVKQNIQDEAVIFGLHQEFISMNVKYVCFTVFPESLDYFKNIGYTCMSKSYVIKENF